jgi:glycosyltransferase involved in cell wall biosynthesis
MPSLSVIVPAHNDEATIASALLSIENAVAYLRRQPGRQQYAAEVIVVDDGSRDATLGVVLDVARGKNLYRIFHRHASSSPSAARNTGVSLSTGDILFFLDADDLFLETHLHECCRVLENTTLDWVKTRITLSDPVHPEWRDRIGNSLVINLAVRRQCHQFIEGFPDIHLFRRIGDIFEPSLDVFRLIEDVYYNNLLGQFFRGAEASAETVRYMRRPGNSFDRQYAKFQHPAGVVRDPPDPDFDYRVRLSKLIMATHVESRCGAVV